jgi:hypothetical protein
MPPDPTPVRNDAPSSARNPGPPLAALAPFLSVLFVALASYLLYYGSRRIENRFLHHSLAASSGLIYFGCIVLGPLYITTASYLRGASPGRRILLASLLPFLWISKDVLVLTASHPFVECLYWYLNPLSAWMVCLVAIEIGVGTLLARYLLKRRGQSLQVISPAPVAAILVGLAVSGAILAWGQGENLFSVYLDGYRLLFGSGL